MDTERQTIDQLLDELRQAGPKPPPELLTSIRDFGAEAVPSLIAMVTDPLDYEIAEGDKENRTGWAPYPMIEILGELHPPEALEPLLSLVDWDDYDYLPNFLPEALGHFGRPALDRLIPVLKDTTQTVWTRGRAMEAMAKIAANHPHLRDEIVATVTAELDADKSDDEDPETLNGFLIDTLRDLKAREALPSIIRAYEEDRVDTFFIRWSDVRHYLDLPADTASHLDELYSERMPFMPSPAPHLPDEPLAVRGTVPPMLAATPPGQASGQPYHRETPKVGRNDPCPCGSGKKYKRCCGR